ncbi:hypothetical protein [Methylorubrum populi]|uniref:hypothetical protein n=1 Tax=Methylorubrum populi TaxID=223967 RepID=UPI0023523B58|nr:hypothetical protein [Methylorubrum populi]
MKNPRIEAKPKEVEFITLSNGGLVEKPDIDLTLFLGNIIDIQQHTIASTPLPQHYCRKSTGPDFILERKGWLHLHVGHDIDDNVLLIVEQTVDKAIFIALTDHDIFKEVPIGRSLIRLGSKVAKAKLPATSTKPASTATTPKPKLPKP